MWCKEEEEDEAEGWVGAASISKQIAVDAEAEDVRFAILQATLLESCSGRDV